MGAQERKITPGDILDRDGFLAVRERMLREIMAEKGRRRVGVGPECTFFFESYDTIRWQIHEMLRVENGGTEQVADEIAAYAPLVPAGNELVATAMFEIADKERRARVLADLAGAWETVFMRIGGDRIAALDRSGGGDSRQEGDRISSVHFLAFPLTRGQIALFSAGEVPVSVGFGHPAYPHEVELPGAMRATLAGDFASG